MVFKSGIPITMVHLDVTRKTALTNDMFGNSVREKVQ